MLVAFTRNEPEADPRWVKDLCKAMDTTSTESGRLCQNAPARHQCGNDAHSESSDDTWYPEWKIKMGTDVVHEQAQHVAREGVTPAEFRR